MKRNKHKDQVRGFISGRAILGQPVITRKDLTNDFANYWINLGIDPITVANGKDTSKIMDSIADDYEYTFRYDGKDSQGKYRNPRLVKKGYVEVY